MCHTKNKDTFSLDEGEIIFGLLKEILRFGREFRVPFVKEMIYTPGLVDLGKQKLERHYQEKRHKKQREQHKQRPIVIYKA